MVSINASVICMDQISLSEDVRIAEEIGVDYLHIDVMDGIAVPRYGMYPEQVGAIQSISDLPLDVHLMVNDVEFAVQEFSRRAEIWNYSFHYDGNTRDIFRILDTIKSNGAKATIIANLATSLSGLADVIMSGEVDGVMIMGIHPGVLRQTARPKYAAERLMSLKSDFGIDDFPSLIQCDGGVSFETIKALGSAGVNNFIVGSSTLYSGVSEETDKDKRIEKIRDNFRKLRDLCDEI